MGRMLRELTRIFFYLVQTVTSLHRSEVLKMWGAPPRETLLVLWGVRDNCTRDIFNMNEIRAQGKIYILVAFCLVVFKKSRSPWLTWNLCFLDASFQRDCGLHDPRTWDPQTFFSWGHLKDTVYSNHPHTHTHTARASGQHSAHCGQDINWHITKRVR
jgi:hypothetical protein